jgi:DNA-binding GntR family transcriptional regulator
LQEQTDAMPTSTISAPGRAGRSSRDACVRLRAMILSGELPSDSELSQNELAQRLGMSRTPVREALRMLQEQGLVEARPNYRATVLGFNAGALEALYCRRSLMEALGVTITVPLMSEDDLNALERAQHRSAALRSEGDFQKWVVANRDFHRRLVMHAGPDLLATIAADCERSEFYQYLYCEKQGLESWFARPEIDHIELVAAYRARKPGWAARIVAQHLAKTALVLLDQFASGYEPSNLRTALRMSLAGSAVTEPHAPPPVMAVPAPTARRSRPSSKRKRAG